MNGETEVMPVVRKVEHRGDSYWAIDFAYDTERVAAIKKLAGSRWSKTTEIYTHVSTHAIGKIKSPFDDL